MADLEEKKSKFWQHAGYLVGGILLAFLSHFWSSHDLAVHSDITDQTVRTIYTNHSTTSAALVALQDKFDNLTSDYQITVGDLAKAREDNKNCQRQVDKAAADLAEMKKLLGVKIIDDRKKKGGGGGGDPFDPGVIPPNLVWDDFHLDPIRLCYALECTKSQNGFCVDPHPIMCHDSYE